MLSDREDSEDYTMFRKYSRDGRELAAVVKRSILPARGLLPGSAQGGLWRLAINDGWIGALAYSGKTSEFIKWIQFKPDGSELSISEIGREHGRGMAFAGSGGLCRAYGEQPTKLTVDCFDRTSQQWKAAPYKAIDANGEPFGILLGAEGSALVYGGNGGNIRLTYVKPAA